MMKDFLVFLQKLIHGVPSPWNVVLSVAIALAVGIALCFILLFGVTSCSPNFFIQKGNTSSNIQTSTSVDSTAIVLPLFKNN